MTQTELPVIITGETLPVTLKILENNLSLQGQIAEIDLSGEFPSVQIQFYKLELAQHRCLVEMLFCRPGQ
jgi:cellulose synthase (UDP-forming)